MLGGGCQHHGQGTYNLETQAVSLLVLSKYLIQACKIVSISLCISLVPTLTAVNKHSKATQQCDVSPPNFYAIIVFCYVAYPHVAGPLSPDQDFCTVKQSQHKTLAHYKRFEVCTNINAQMLPLSGIELCHHARRIL